MFKHTKEVTRLTRITIVGCALVLIAYFSIALANAEATEADIVVEISSICAAATGLVAVKMPDGLERDLVNNEGIWWFAFLEEFTGSNDIATTLAGNVMRELQLKYDTNELDWDAMVSLAMECTNAKEEILHIIAEPGGM